MVATCLQPLWKFPSPFLGSYSSSFLQNHFQSRSRDFNCYRGRRVGDKRNGGVIVCGLPLPIDPWAPTIDSESIASQLFAFSLFPYIGFLYFITKSKTAPKLTLFGFYFLLAFVGATSEFPCPFLYLESNFSFFRYRDFLYIFRVRVVVVNLWSVCYVGLAMRWKLYNGMGNWFWGHLRMK